MTAVARLMEEGKLDLDKPVQEYVPSFPEKEWEGEKVQTSLVSFMVIFSVSVKYICTFDNV